MRACKFLCVVCISIVQDGPIVTREDDEGVVCDAHALERSCDLTYCPVQLKNGITSRAHRALSCETSVWPTRYVNVIGAEIHKEG